MNNNKISKKWLLGLVAPALILAPIAVVASCSSSTTESATKKATTAKSEIKISQFAEVAENTTSQEFKSEFDSKELTSKQELVFNKVANLLDGDHEVKQANQIINPTITAVTDDETKLTLSFKLAANTWYGSDGKLGSTESSDFTITITEFSTDQPNPTGNQTVANPEVNVQTLDPTLAQVEASNFKDRNTEETLRQLVAEKMSDLFTGDHNVKSETDIQSAELEDVSGQDTQLNLKVKLKAKTWYDDSKNLGETESEVFEIKLTGFKASGSSSGSAGLRK